LAHFDEPDEDHQLLSTAADLWQFVARQTASSLLSSDPLSPARQFAISKQKRTPLSSKPAPKANP